MLSRHLYEIDEVKSALQICLRRQSWRALFWLWELVVSDETDDARQVLRDTWLMWGAPHDIALIRDIDSAPLTEDTSGPCIGILRRIMDACEKTGSRSSFRYLNEQEHTPNRRFWTTHAPTPASANRRRVRSAQFVASLDAEDMSSEDATLFWIGLDSSLRRGLRSDAFWFLQAAQPILSANAIWSALSIASRGGAEPVIHDLKSTAPMNITGQILHQAAAVLFLCTRVADRTQLATPSFPLNKVLQGDWDHWSSIKNRREARVHAIPVDALHKGTTRGQISTKYTNIADVRDPVPLLLEGCTWWRRVANSIGLKEEDGDILFPSDDAMERLSDVYFPDDIPDEWSTTDQQKSHGRGVAETALPEPSVWIRTERLDERPWKTGCFLSPLQGCSWNGRLH